MSDGRDEEKCASDGASSPHQKGPPIINSCLSNSSKKIDFGRVHDENSMSTIAIATQAHSLSLAALMQTAHRDTHGPPHSRSPSVAPMLTTDGIPWPRGMGHPTNVDH